MSYIALKHLHTTLATLTLLLFVLRGGWMMMESGMLQKRWVKITPHVIHTLLLVSAFAVAWVGWQYPVNFHPWITAKLVGLVAYIVLGVLAFKSDRSKGSRIVAFAGALVVYGYLVLVALQKSVLPF